MGLTHVEGTLTGPTGEQSTLRFLVDSGASYTLVPTGVWQQLGIEPIRTVDLVLAGSTTITREVGECRIELEQGYGTTPVILGEEGDEALLGVVTLEILGLVFNPLNRTLRPMRMMLA